MTKWIAASIIVLAATGVGAQEIGYEKDSLGFAAMMDGDWSSAEAQLAASADELSNDPAHLLNLAQVYAATGRDADAAATYARVLEQEDMVLVLSDGRKVSAHMLAGSKLSTVATASR